MVTIGGMTPWFGRDAALVAWFDGEHIFSPKMKWIGYLRSGHAFRSSDGQWVGRFDGATLQDSSGKAIVMDRRVLRR